MKYYYFSGNRKIYITMKKACPEYINLDCPYVYDEFGNVVIKFDYFFKYINSTTERELDLIKKWLSASDRAFHRKYPTIQTVKEGHILKNINYYV